MKIDSTSLASLMTEVARKHFAGKRFHRRDLMELVERETRERGLWEPEDDRISGSRGLKSMGLAAMDYRFSDLAHAAFLPDGKRGFWRLSS